MGMKKVIAIDIGGTNIRIALVENNKIFKLEKFKTSNTKKEFLRTLINGIKKLDSSRVIGIGVSIAGPVKSGIIKNPPNLPLKNFDIRKFLKKIFKKRVEVENDANCAALAELNFGIKKKNFVVITLGTGVGCGVVIDKKLYIGDGYASELGHMILHNGKDFEYYWKLHKKETRKYFGKYLSIKELMERKDKTAQRIANENIEYVAQGLASIINIFDPEVIVITGGGKNNGKIYLKKIKNKMRKYVIIPKQIVVYYSKLENPGILGASLLLTLNPN